MQISQMTYKSPSKHKIAQRNHFRSVNDKFLSPELLFLPISHSDVYIPCIPDTYQPSRGNTLLFRNRHARFFTFLKLFIIILPPCIQIPSCKAPMQMQLQHPCHNIYTLQDVHQKSLCFLH